MSLPWLVVNRLGRMLDQRLTLIRYPAGTQARGFQLPHDPVIVALQEHRAKRPLVPQVARED
jgi:hypothetical protein